MSTYPVPTDAGETGERPQQGEVHLFDGVVTGKEPREDPLMREGLVRVVVQEEVVRLEVATWDRTQSPGGRPAGHP